ncbi:inducible metalloproteinase inhibitor protein-like [Anoplophora glabripennis]|uniref:inducible metalloproteinase inhibitor protein-like n=1 Tax=Anoplophora glabripennis TaxID=217634 RepID=UPI0008750DCA|nr:inducible metalloproteinase inhibitor protein-like [Anoplophora glabripennis]
MKSWLLLVVFVYFVSHSFAHTLPPGGIEWQNCTRPHEVYKCGSACQTECATLGEICPIVNIRCNDSCYCVDGYARDTDGVCIKIANCPPKSK